VRHYRRGECGDDGGDGHDDCVLRMLYPAQRIVSQQNVAHGAAAQGRGKSNNDHAESIHPATPGGQRAGHGFGGNAN